MTFSYQACGHLLEPGSEPWGLGTQVVVLVPTTLGEPHPLGQRALFLCSTGTGVASAVAKHWAGKASPLSTPCRH